MDNIPLANNDVLFEANIWFKDAAGQNVNIKTLAVVDTATRNLIVLGLNPQGQPVWSRVPTIPPNV